VASNNKKVTSSDYDFDDENEVPSFSRILDKTKSIEKDTSPQTETRNKDVTNPEQTRNKPVMAEVETRNKDVTETRNSSYAKTETRNKPVAQTVTNPEQTRNKPVMDLGFNSATTFQKEILSCIYHSMKSSIDKSTPPMSLTHFGACLGKHDSKGLESLRVVALRLEKMGLLIRSKIRNGRGGWTQYSLPQKVYSDIREFETRNEPVINPEHSRNKPVTKPVTTDLSSSRDVFLKDSSTTQEPVTVFDQIGSLDLSSLREFGITHETFKRAVQLHPMVTIEAVSDLSFRLSELFKNPKERAKIQNARGFVIKLVEQLAQGITPLDHIETADERLMREYAVLAKQKKLEQQDFENALLQAAFEKWDKETLEEDKFQKVPLAQSAPAGNPRVAVFREYYREQVWPEEREAILRGKA
jgi:hypothetical protein